MDFHQLQFFSKIINIEHIRFMKIKDLKIGTILKLGFGIILSLVIALGGLSYYQTNVLHNQTKTMYEHPLQVRRAIAGLKENILNIKFFAKDILFTDNKQEITFAAEKIQLSKADFIKHLDIIYFRYLGPQADVDSINKYFVILNNILDANVQKIFTGQKDEMIEVEMIYNNIHIQVENINSKIENVSQFAIKKGDELFKKSEEVNSFLNIELIIILSLIIIISFIIISFIIKTIRNPLIEINLATKLFKEGNYSKRSKYTSKNEFGNLSNSFNNLAETIEKQIILNEKITSITTELLSEDKSHEFSKILLSDLLKHTDSQIAAIYLLNEDKTYFELFESIGLENNAVKTFSAKLAEGEFGKSLVSQKIEIVKNVSENSGFNFIAVSGYIKPNEIITIPVLSNDETVAIISIATTSVLSELSLKLIHELQGIINARIISILATRTIMKFSEKLEKQNSELESQKSELSSQTNELTEQNIELELQKKQLDEANKLKTNFLSNMSHELRTPLNSVIALSGVLNRRLKDQINEQDYSYIEVIERNGKHLLYLINDILDLSRIEAGKDDIEINKFNLKDLLDEIISTIEPQAHLKNIQLFLNESNNYPHIETDFNKCRHILQNLIGNAIKFTETGKVEITSKLTKEYVKIAITDTGIGISEYQINHIFDEFRQADGSTSRKYGGTGLGLAIAKKYANLLEGKIEVKSELGKGSEFTLVIPLKTKFLSHSNSYDYTSLTSVSANLKAEKVDNPNEKTILLVEDSEPAIIQLKYMLEAEGYNLEVAKDGGEAMKSLTSTLPDAMILDLMMPEIDGFDVIRLVRENEKTKLLPIIILTAKHIEKKDYDFFKTNNIIQLIQKGDVNKIELLNAVAKMLTSKIEIHEKPTIKIQKIEGKPLVLIVEDNPDNMITTKALIDDKFDILEALDGFEGVEQAKKYKPNLILMDIALPEMNGIEAFKRIRQNESTKDIPIVVLTASAMKGEKEKIMSYGFDGYITKPIEEKIFFNTINQILYGSK